MKKKIILVDDMYERFADNVFWACEAVGFCELIKTGNAETSASALKMIKDHPEADLILLDGTFEEGNCLDVLPRLSDEEREKVICYSNTPEVWMDKLFSYGIYHFSAKGIDFPGCILGTCSCAEKNKSRHVT